MSEIADFLRGRIAERREQADSIHRRDCESLPDVLHPGRETGACDCGEPESVVADCDAKLALVKELEPPEEPDLTPRAGGDEVPWCCGGFAAFCPLCTDRTGATVHCEGHAATDENAFAVRTARLHARCAHPAYEYATTEGQRKQWDDADMPPLDEDGKPEPGWERNTDAGIQGWERFDYTEESYWRRLRPGGPRPVHISRALKILAQPFAGHPDHKGEEWAP